MKVRLKLKYNLTSKVCLLFQFHEGPIKTTELEKNFGHRPCFNSMKVRLKPYGSADASHAAAFQFHEGPIKTRRF